jgi:hypothetical protein
LVEVFFFKIDSKWCSPFFPFYISNKPPHYPIVPIFQMFFIYLLCKCSCFHDVPKLLACMPKFCQGNNSTKKKSLLTYNFSSRVIKKSWLMYVSQKWIWTNIVESLAMTKFKNYVKMANQRPIFKCLQDGLTKGNAL